MLAKRNHLEDLPLPEACALNLVVFRAAVDHELDEDDLVQARLRGDVPAVPVHYLFLVRVCSAHGVMVRTN